MYNKIDFDGKGYIAASDIKEVVRRITGDEEGTFTDDEMDKIVTHVLAEADINKSDNITPQEFRHVMTKSPEFAHNFRLRF